MGLTEIVVIVVYLLAIGYLGYRGYAGTQTASDYLVAGRSINPFVMALSYGATFISTSAIVGFGGVAGMFGMSLLWLTFLNILVGIFLAFVLLGGRTRKMGHHLDAHTFPELLGRRFDSRFVQVAAGLVIFLFIPLYSAAVLIGGCEFIHAQLGMSYESALLLFSVIIAVYVVAGGLKGVMYTDALQGAIMFFGMLVLLVWTYYRLGGVTAAHQSLTDMSDRAFVGFQTIGHRGWTAMPAFGWGGPEYNLWWIVISTITLGVGIGVLAQPQLAVRFMTVSSKKQLNRAVLIGGVFILVMVGVPYTVGSLSNAYFLRHETVTGELVGTTESADVIVKKERGVEKTMPCRLLHLDTTGNGEADVHVVAEGLGGAAEIMPRAEVERLGTGDRVAVRPRATSFLRTPVRTMDGGWMFNSDSIMPEFVRSIMPRWFGIIFLLTLLAAAMSTLSSQFHTLGTSIGRDVYQQLTGSRGSVGVTRVGVIVGIIIAVIISYHARGGYIIARATAIFFGLCCATFLPAYLGALFWRGMTRAGAISSMLAGFLTSGFWLLFVKAKEAGAIGLVQQVTGGEASILASRPNWPVVDPIVVALPAALVVGVAVSLLTRPLPEEHVEWCFGGPKPERD
jgi:SSS family solute:Na+ symporter